ncbi:gp53-like domain-containing protein, partial [Enterobacter asburiae]|uniref:gp53-like domain-containing protein n=2 Tax=Enterobacter asburiae TaxID=61645 RepID=UPI003AFA5051
GLQYSISEPDTETVVYTLPGGYKLMAFNRLVNNSTVVGAGVTTPITFPQAFPSRLIAVFATKKNYVQAAVSCENQSLTGFDAVVTLITTIAGGITSTRAMFFAIGK